MADDDGACTVRTVDAGGGRNDAKGGVGAGHRAPDTADGNLSGNKHAKKFKRRPAPACMLGDPSFIADAERDELHVEIYNYLQWLHAKLYELEQQEKARAESDVKKLAETEDLEEMEDPAEINKEEDTTSKKVKKLKKKLDEGPLRSKVGVDVAQLGAVLANLEAAFAVVQNVPEEEGRGERRSALP